MGVILTSLASLVGTVGKILFKVAHTAEARANLYDSHGDLAQAKHERLQSRLTWAAGAIGIMVLNPVGDTAAYAFASQSMLVPFAALSIVWNTLCAPWLLHEKITKRDLFGTTIIVGGCTLVAVSSSHSPVVYTASSLAARFYAPWFLAFVFFMCSAAALLCHLLSTRHTGSIAHRIAAGALGGVIGGNLYLVKCTTLLLLMPRPRPWWTYPGNYVVAAGAALSAGGGLMFLSRALSWYPAVTVIPVYQSSLIIFGCMSAAAFFDDEGQKDTHVRVHPATRYLCVWW